MRCPDCNKFVSMDTSDPEVGNLEFDIGSMMVMAQVRIERTCSDCGTGLKEANLELSWSAEGEDATKLEEHLKAHKTYADTHDGQEPGQLDVEEDGADLIEEGGVRYKKSYYGAEVQFTISCTCDKEFELSNTMSEKVSASEMEEIS
jgi:hypothetical protein